MIKPMIGKMAEKIEHKPHCCMLQMKEMREEVADHTAAKASHFLSNAKKFRGGY